MNRLFSIIIPCYNASAFIDVAMQSVILQTIDRSEYEVIAVNDASTDDTLDKLLEWERKYPDMIKVITYNTNLRQGGARNIAIKQATGQYLCYLDADDWLEPDALCAYKEGISRGGFDMVTVRSEENPGYRIINEEGRSGDYPVAEISDIVGSDLGYVCCSVYRKSIVTDNELWFPEHLAYEDVYWQRMIKFYVKSAAIVDHIAYHHYIHEASTINSVNAPYHTDRLTAYEMYLSKSEEKGFLKDHYEQIMDDTMETYLFNSYYMFFTLLDEIPDVYCRMRETIYRYFPDWETVYDDSKVPMVFQYLLKFIKKAKVAKPADIQPFKDSVLELIAQ